MIIETLTAQQERPHYQFSGSKANTWYNCAGALHEAEKLGIEQASNKHMEEGNKAHGLSELVLLENSYEKEHYSERMRNNIDAFSKYVHDIPGTLMLVEAAVPLFYKTEHSAYIDVLLIEDDCLHIIDFKNGMHEVPAKNNLQLLIYAYSAFLEVGLINNDIKRVKMHIYQPNLLRAKPEDTWEISVDDLRRISKQKILRRFLYVDSDVRASSDFVANPDVQCRYCPLKGSCTTLAAYHTKTLGLQNTLTLPEVATLDYDTKLRFMQSKAQIKEWLDACVVSLEKEALKKAEKGEKTPGMKAVKSITERKWGNEEEAASLLSKKFKFDEVYKKTLRGPAQIEKLIKHKRQTKIVKAIQNLIEKPEGQTVMVLETDRRKPIDVLPAFGPVEEEAE